MAKEKNAPAQIAPASSHSAVETIVSALSELENDIDSLYVRVEEMKKRIMALSNEQVEKLKQQVVAMANEEAKRIVDDARSEAETESEKIAEMGRANVTTLKKNIESSFDLAVDSIVKTVLGDGSAMSAQKAAKSKM